jgi:hypothetical protein
VIRRRREDRRGRATFIEFADHAPDRSAAGRAVAGIDRRVGLQEHHAPSLRSALTMPRVTVFWRTPSADPIAIF